MRGLTLNSADTLLFVFVTKACIHQVAISCSIMLKKFKKKKKLWKSRFSSHQRPLSSLISVPRLHTSRKQTSWCVNVTSVLSSCTSESGGGELRRWKSRKTNVSEPNRRLLTRNDGCWEIPKQSVYFYPYRNMSKHDLKLKVTIDLYWCL